MTEQKCCEKCGRSLTEEEKVEEAQKQKSEV